MGLLPLWRRAIARLRRNRLDDQLADEIRLHLELRRQALIDDGCDPRGAEAEARRRFGNVLRRREDSRDQWGFRAIDAFLQDVRFGVRLLRRSPMFSVVAVLSLAIGIGATSAVFSLADALLFRKLPVEAPDDLTLFQWRSGPRDPAPSLSGNSRGDATMNVSTSFSLPTFMALRREAAGAARVFGFAKLGGDVDVTIGRESDIASAQFVSGNYYSTLGVHPAAGRLLVDSDDQLAASPAAVISHAFWVRRFGASPGAVGTIMTINRLPVTIVGVAPKGFQGTLELGDSPSLSLPLALRPAIDTRGQWTSPSMWWVLVMARLEPGVTPDALQSALDAVLKRSVAEGVPDLASHELPRLELLPGARGLDEVRASGRNPLSIMASVVIVVLLVACANIANLLLVRGTARRREVALRSAIGASRGRLVRQLLTESIVLAILGSIGGLLVASSIAAALLPAVNVSSIDAFDIRTDWRLFAFTALIAGGCSALFGVVPALRTTRVGIAAGLQDSTRGTSAAPRRASLTGMLVVVQIALSVLLVVVAGLLVHSVRNLYRVDTGFDATNTLLFDVYPGRSGYDQPRTRVALEQIRERLSLLPAVRSASFSHTAPISGSEAIAVGLPLDAPAFAPNSVEEHEFRDRHRTWRMTVADQFFATMGIAMLNGRTFSAGDSAAAPPVAVVNRALAERLFGRIDVVGQRFRVSSRAFAAVVEIIGVCANAKYASLRAEPPPTVYVSYRQINAGPMTFEVKTAGDPTTIVPLAREAVRSIDPHLPISGIRTQETQIQRALVRERLMATLATGLGVIALFLAGIGLYGMLAYSVSRRVPEIGVRLALGAGRRAVCWMVIRNALLLTALGLAIGLATARAGTAVVQSLLFGLSPTDPVTFLGAAIVMMAIAGAAAAIPALRASRVDPIIALRTE
jgi:predicted permease